MWEIYNENLEKNTDSEFKIKQFKDKPDENNRNSTPLSAFECEILNWYSTGSFECGTVLVELGKDWPGY